MTDALAKATEWLADPTRIQQVWPDQILEVIAGLKAEVELAHQLRVATHETIADILDDIADLPNHDYVARRLRSLIETKETPK